MNKKELMFLDKVIKATKTTEFVILPDMIIGRNSGALVEVKLATGLDRPAEYLKDTWKSFIDLVNESKEMEDYTKFVYYYSVKRVNDIPLIASYNNALLYTTNYSMSIDDLKIDDEFASILAQKAADGASPYKINKKYILYIYSGLLPINKKDRASVDIYDIYNPDGSQELFLAKYGINKGFAHISEYVLYKILRE